MEQKIPMRNQSDFKHYGSDSGNASEVEWLTSFLFPAASPVAPGGPSMSSGNVNPPARAGRLFTPPDTARPSPSPGELWAGRALTGLAVLFLLFDAAGKFVLPQQVVNASIRLGFPVHLNFALALILTLATLLYLVPITAVLGAVLLTGYLGGAVAIQMRAGSSAFETIFPVLFGFVLWAGIFLRDAHLREVFPLRLRRDR
jgi:hypothetical protein